MKALLLVFIGGGLGSLLRYAIGLWIGPLSEKFPYSTLTANIISCILLGIFIGIATRNMLTFEMKLLLMTGLCGGFSTFSTFSAETYQLFNTGHYFSALLYVAGSFVICLFCIFLGLKLSGA